MSIRLQVLELRENCGPNSIELICLSIKASLGNGRSLGQSRGPDFTKSIDDDWSGQRKTAGGTCASPYHLKMEMVLGLSLQ